ncbi:hypothetical protein KUV75_04470 [Qipengyuania gaetbuli]|uniref:hypothetical protein n=1 Tax=Qipengyuania gaetbuli TaxID=266952 RepID=UPI001C9A1FB9|nr:hypothetical protein [Qipengyuania gaetbuli]MBY6014155.1 hypothetical protein [Qipengyuania gaetbuli]
MRQPERNARRKLEREGLIPQGKVVDAHPCAPLRDQIDPVRDQRPIVAEMPERARTQRRTAQVNIEPRFARRQVRRAFAFLRHDQQSMEMRCQARLLPLRKPALIRLHDEIEFHIATEAGAPPNVGLRCPNGRETNERSRDRF